MRVIGATYEVVIVGAGAAGLAAAVGARATTGSRRCWWSERTEPPTLPRATVISTRSMELLRAWGLEEEIARRRGRRRRLALGVPDARPRPPRAPPTRSGYPSREQAAVVSPCAPGTVPQDWLEAVLRRHVGALPGTSGSSSAPSWSGSRTRPTGSARRCATATAGAATCGPATSSAADGAHSAVRRLLGVGMQERDGAYGGVQVVFRAPLWPLLGDVRYALYFVTTPARAGLFLPAGPGRPLGLRPVVAVRGPASHPTSIRDGSPRLIRAGSPASSTSIPRSSGSGRSSRRASWPTGSASGARSWPATPRTGSRHGAAPA